MRQGILAILMIFCGLLPRTASAVPMDYYFAFTLTAQSSNDIIGVDGALFEFFAHIDPDVNNNDFLQLATATGWARERSVPEPAALSLFAGALLMMWAATRRRTFPRINTHG